VIKVAVKVDGKIIAMYRASSLAALLYRRCYPGNNRPWSLHNASLSYSISFASVADVLRCSTVCLFSGSISRRI